MFESVIAHLFDNVLGSYVEDFGEVRNLCFASDEMMRS